MWNSTIPDFNSWNIDIPCIAHYAIKKQFQKAYITSKFKAVQEEFIELLYLNISGLEGDCGKYNFIVVDEIEVSDKFINRANCIVLIVEDLLDIT